MNIEQLLQAAPAVNVTISAQDLKTFACGLIAQTRTELERSVATGQVESLLTIDEVASKLRVDRTTLYRWNRRGYLTSIEVGGKKRYRQSDINEIINQRSQAL